MKQLTRTDAVGFIEKVSSHLNGFFYQCKRDVDGHYSMPFVSDKIQEIYLLSPNDVKTDATPLFAMTHPDDFARLKATIEQSAEQMDIWQCEWRIKRPDGQERWLHGSSTPEKQADGSVVWFGYVKNITELKRLQEVENMTQVALHQKFNTLPDLLFEIDASGKCHHIHATGASSLIKQQYASFIDQYIQEFLPKEVFDALSNALAEVVNNSGMVNRQVLVDTKGESNWFDVSITQSDQFDSSHLYVVLVRDVTQQKQDAYHSRINAVAFNAISEAMIVSDADLIIQSVNPAFEQLTGFTRDYMVGKKARFYSGLNDKETIAEIRQALKTHVEYKGVVKTHKKDGSIFYNQLSITPVFDENKTLVNYIGLSRDVTEILDLRDVAEQSRQFLLTVIDAVPSRIFWKDKYSNYLGCNKAYAIDIGLENPKDIYLKLDTDLWPAPFADKFRQDDIRVMESGVDKLFNEEEALNVHGEKEWVVKSKVILRNEQGETMGVLGIYDVVTDKKVAQQKLIKTQQKFRESNEKYMDLYEFAPVGYMTVDQGGMVVEANWKARAMMGVKRKEMGQVRFNTHVSPSDKSLWQAEFSSLLLQAPGSEMTFELAVLSADGQTINLNLSCIHSEGEGDSAVIRITMIDVTDEKKSAVLLRRKEEYQRSLLDNFPYMVWLKDELGRFLTVNQMFLDAAGLNSVEDVAGKNDLDIWSEDLAKKYMQQDHFVLEQRQAASNHEMIEVDGTRKWFETYKSPVIVSDQVIGTVGFARDVSDLKRSVLYEQFKSQMLELVINEHDLSKVYDSITRGVEQLNPDIFCMIALATEDKKNIDITSAPSLPAYVNDAFGEVRVGMGQGTIGTAIFSKTRVIVTDVMSHPYWKKNRDVAEKAGIAASWGEPIIGSNGEVYGAFGMYVSQPVAPAPHDLMLIEQAASLVSIAIERHRSTSEIERLAYYDNVTGLPNRRYFIEVTNRLISTKEERDFYHVLLYLDLNAFKAINDARGTAVGDLLLKAVAKRLEKTVGNDATVARMGNDEYAILVSHIDGDELKASKKAEQLSSRILKAMNRTFTIKKEKHHVGASVGVNVFIKDHHKIDADSMIKQAEIAMNQAEQMGGNVFSFFNPEMQKTITEKVALEQALRKAMQSNELALFYQLQVDAAGTPFGAEALLRWIHPDKGVILPSTFISLAEESELIIEIGDWVLETACAQLERWQQQEKTRHLTLSINISAVQFMQDDFVDIVNQCIGRYEIEPSSLRFELTESMLLGNVEETAEMMNALGELGIQFSLDDFGTGYSSLQYLKRLPLYQLKIDRSFVKDIEHDAQDRTIIRTIIAMAQSMYIGVIAEGVETEEQKTVLLENGCKRYQGYLFSKPLPLAELQAQLDSTLLAASID